MVENPRLQHLPTVYRVWTAHHITKGKQQLVNMAQIKSLQERDLCFWFEGEQFKWTEIPFQIVPYFWHTYSVL